MDPSALSSNGRRLLGLIEFDDKEKLLYEIRKHPFGLVLIYFVGLFVSVMILISVAVLLAVMEGDGLGIGASTGSMTSIAVLVGGFLILLSFIITAIAAYLYKSNVVVVTSDKITQVLYRTIFDRKLSQLSIGDVQDTTVSQVGIFARLFNYGTLVIETAGEQQNYTFTYVPNPYEASKVIVGAHEENLKLYGN